MTKDQETAIADKALKAFELAGYPTMNDNERFLFNSSIMVLATEFMREIAGDEHVREFYTDAVKSLRDPVAFEAKRMDLQ